MAGIQMSGLSSGLDTASIVSQLMAIEKLPRNRLTSEQAQIQARRTNLNGIQSKLETLKLAAHDLGSIASWGDKQSVASTDDTKLSVRTYAGAGPGGYDVVIDSLAGAARRTYAFATSTSPQTITIKDKGGAQTGSFPLAADATIDDAVAAINGSPEAGVFAVNVDGALVLAARTTGKASDFTATGAGALTDSANGVDASFTVNGKAYTSATNVVKNAVAGLELTLKARTTSTTVNVGNPGPDTSVIRDKLKAFVAAYNGALGEMRTDVAEKRVPKATTTSDAAKGSLFGDSGVADIIDTLRSSVSDPVSGFTAASTKTGLSTLAQLGISTGAATSGTTVNADAVAGKLSFDELAFSKALEADPLGVQKLLGGVTGRRGFAQAFESVVDGMSGTTGRLRSRITSADSDLSRLTQKLTTFDARMDMKQTYLERQFRALESAMAKSQNLGVQLAATYNNRAS
jgi:flagellar hook-associated protein 2